jgi:hypothetical protein
MLARRLLLTLVGAAAVCAFAVASPASARTSVWTAEPTTYSDATGDAKSAPDVATVAVSVDATAAVFVVSLASGDLSNEGILGIAIDADRNAATGDRFGSDYVVLVTADGAGFLKWNGSDMKPFSHQPMVLGRNGSTIAVGVCTCDLGTQAFDFVVLGVRGNDIDAAPESGHFSYPQAAPPAPEISIASVLVNQRPSVPKAGKRFTVKVMGARLEGTGEVVQPESVECSARLGTKALRGTGPGGCSWKLPKNARGKKLTVAVTVTYQGVEDTFAKTMTVT